MKESKEDQHNMKLESDLIELKRTQALIFIFIFKVESWCTGYAVQRDLICAGYE